MILFFDTSALVKLFQAEDGTATIIEWVEAAEKLYLLDIARLEFTSVLQRRLRNKELNPEGLLIIQQGFYERWTAFNIQPLNRKVVDEAENLLNKY
ncbi:MAG: type II toxin-antitoxin system VapC family toxin [Desulfamplus sp.]|nr:type II toxin-antitoxin system VapC family toxin [Desulfamplus sp.]